MIAKEKFGLLMMFILFFSIVYLFLDDSHFSGINTLEEMIRNEVLQKKIDPIVEKEVQENFENSEEKEIKKKGRRNNRGFRKRGSDCKFGKANIV